MSDHLSSTVLQVVCVASVQCDVVYGEPHANAKFAVDKLGYMARRSRAANFLRFTLYLATR